MGIAVVLGLVLGAGRCLGQVPVITLPREIPRGAQPNDRSSQSAAGLEERTIDGPMERVRMRNGQTYEGLVQDERAGGIEFAEILQPPGRPMFLVVRPLLKKDIAAINRLEGPRRDQLVKLVNTFRHRARIEAERMEDISLKKVSLEGLPEKEVWSYSGPWFRLESTAGAEVSRGCIARIEQMFRAYRQLLPPLAAAAETPPGGVPPAPRPQLRILLFGSMEGYRQYLHEQDFDIKNPAFYSARENRIVAGCDLQRMTDQLAAMHQRNETLRLQYQQMDDQFNSRFADTARQLQENGYSPQEIQFERQIRLAAWKRELRAMLDKIDKVDRRNQRQFTQVVEQTFSRLYHEAFHAYLENYVYPGRTYDVPRWLNEGLAQVFEDGQLDGELLRIDAPNPEKLRQLQAYLDEGDFTLAEFLKAERQSLVMSHSRSLSYRHYLYAWGLAWHLAFQTGDLNRQQLTEYVRRPKDDESSGPVQRFEQLVEMPLEQFQQQWRQAMLQLRP